MEKSKCVRSGRGKPLPYKLYYSNIHKMEGVRKNASIPVGEGLASPAKENKTDAALESEIADIRREIKK